MSRVKCERCEKKFLLKFWESGVVVCVCVCVCEVRHNSTNFESLYLLCIHRAGNRNVSKINLNHFLNWNISDLFVANLKLVFYVYGSVHHNILWNKQTDATICSQFHFTATFTLHVSGALYTHHQEYNFSNVFKATGTNNCVVRATCSKCGLVQNCTPDDGCNTAPETCRVNVAVK